VNTAVTNRAAAIRDYLSRREADPLLSRRYSLIAAHWEALRLARDKDRTTPADDASFLDLCAILTALTAKLGLITHPGPEAVDGITDGRGFLPHDPQRIVHAETWRSAAEDW
jgi:hypothetical protein